MTLLKFISLSSGSCGNCYFLGRFSEDGKCLGGVLIDAGVSLRRLKTILFSNGLDVDDIGAVLVTHDHMDHVRSLASYCKKIYKPLWTSETLAGALAGRSLHLSELGVSPNVLREGEWNSVGDFLVRYFIVPHDATQTVGFAIRVPMGDVEDGLSSGEGAGGFGAAALEGDYSEQFRQFFIMTDAGRVTDEALSLARESDTVVFESNYDVDMLFGGPYTHELKMRISGGCGHLSNDECAEAVKKFWHPGLKNLFLCHLSENNNTPRLAYEAVRAALDSVSDGTTALRPLPRTSPTDLIVL